MIDEVLRMAGMMTYEPKYESDCEDEINELNLDDELDGAALTLNGEYCIFILSICDGVNNKHSNFTSYQITQIMTFSLETTFFSFSYHLSNNAFRRKSCRPDSTPAGNGMVSRSA